MTESSGRRYATLSIVMPTLDEFDALGGGRADLVALRDQGHEIIVVDGGSTDGTTTAARSFATRVVGSSAGRARQMNAGAALAKGGVLLFLHADTLLPWQATQAITDEMARTRAVWGRFDVRLSGGGWALRVIEFFMNWRSRLTGIATGDQALFIDRAVFESIGGYPEIELMEDVAMSNRLKRITPPACLRLRAGTSSRRWERNGIVRTVLLMWRLRLAYALGAKPARLARIYYRD